jgi:hypothetical protein
MDNRPEGRASLSDQARVRAWLFDWLPAGVAFVLLSLISEFRLFGADGSWDLFWSLLFLAPALWIVRAVVRSVRRADEYQARQQLEAMAIGFGVQMFSIFTIGQLQAADVGNLRQLVQISFIGSVVVWMGALWLKTPRIR